MDIAALSAGNRAAGSNGASAADSQKAFRDADFMKMLLAEITQQDPFKPQDTGQIVDGMQKLQQLANTKYQKFRDDQRFAQDLMGKDVTVQQASLQPKELEALKAKGLNPDVGFGTVQGKVDTYRVVDETVYLNVGGKDYAIDNLYQINPPQKDTSYLAGLASGILGTNASYYDTDPGKLSVGKVTAISLNGNNDVMLTIGGKDVPFSHVKKIAL